MKDYQDINASTIDRWVCEGWEWGKPITHEEYLKALKGEYKLYLTPTKEIPKDWLKDIKGKKILGLASGGAQQMPILTALGANCTILDYSDLQLKSEKEVSIREGYNINIVKADMSKPLPFKDNEFDMIIHPVSNIYIEEVEPLFKECYRILKKGGVLLGGYDNGINYLVDDTEKKIVWEMPFNPLKNNKQKEFILSEDCGYQFSHSLTDNIGGQLKAGFRILDIYEDTNGGGYLDKLNINTFYSVLSIKD